MRLASLFLALALVGCHDYIVDPPVDDVEPPAPQPVPQLPAMTLKGPKGVTPGDTPMYKAGMFSGDVTYHFQINGADAVLFSRDNDEDRYFYTEVVGQGRAELRVTAINAEGEEIAFARRWIESVR